MLRRGELLNSRKVDAYVRQLRRQHKTLQKIVACVDCEEFPSSEVQLEVSQVLTDIRRLAPPVMPEYVVVMHALEAWTGADEDALRSYLNVPPRRQLRPVREDDPRPKRTLSQLFQQNGRDFLETRDNPRLAKIVSLELLRERNSSFAEFERKVMDP